MPTDTPDFPAEPSHSPRDRLMGALQHPGTTARILGRKASRRITVWTFLVMVVWTGFQWLIAPAAGIRPESPLWNSLFVLTSTTAANWWTWITAIFAHAGTTHFAINAIALLSVGLSVEYSIQKRKFLTVFLGGALLSEIAQLARVEAAAASPSIALLGASGGIAALAGALSIYQPDSRFYVLYIFPVRTLYVILTFIALSVALSTLEPMYGGFAHAGHATGAIVGLTVALLDTSATPR